MTRPAPSAPGPADPRPADGWSDADAVSVARARARVYGLLAATFDGDIGTLAAALDDGTFAELAASLPGDAGGETLAGCALDAETLSIGYDNLFVVPGPHYVPPFASAHATDPSESFESDSPYHDAGDAGELFGDPAAAAAHAYAAVGFDPNRGDGIPDHLAASFEFMRALCAREAELAATTDENAEALAAVRRVQRETLSRLGWLDAFHEAVAAADTVEGVFAALARFARTFAAWDAREGVSGSI